MVNILPASRLELLHPMIVHLPVALAYCWVCFELIAWAWIKRGKELDLAFLLMSVMGAISAFFANMTGEWAEHIHLQQTTIGKAVIEHHAEMASYVLWFYLLLTVIAAVILIVRAKWLRIVRFGVSVGLLIIVTIVAYRGAQLVYEHGLGVNLEGVKKLWQKPSTQ